MRRKTWSLAARAPTVAGLIVILIVAIVSTLAAIKEYGILRGSAMARLEATAGVLASSAAVPLSRLDVATLRDLMLSARKAPGVECATVFDAEGRVVTDGSLENPRRFEPVGPNSRAVLTEPGGKTYREGDDRLIAACAIRSGNAVIGGVECEASTDVIRRQSMELLTSQGTTAVLLAGVLGFLVWIWVRKILAPGKKLIEGMDRLTAGGDLGEFPTRGPVEIHRISEAFTRLINQLRETTLSREMLSGILEGIGEGLLVLSEDGLIEDSNRVLEEMVGRSRDQFKGLPGHSLFNEEREENFRRLIAECLKDRNHTVHHTSELTPTSGKSLPVLLSFRAATKVGGAGFMIICLVQDISESKKIEKMKARFLATISHELRTPITSIKGTLDLMAGGAVGQLPEGARRMIEIAQVNTSRMLMLINDLLDLEKAKEGKLSLRVRVSDLSEIVRKSVELAEGFTLAKKLSFELVAEDTLPVRADPDRVHQVMMNFLSNAGRYAPEHSTILISVRGDGRVARVEVVDRGPGVPLAFRKHLFQRFSQAGDGDGSIKGSGLGLALARELIERMDGKIGYREADGGGAVFWFELPRTRDGEKSQEITDS